MIISERIFYVMEQKNITQLELSRRTGIATSNISDWKKDFFAGQEGGRRYLPYAFTEQGIYMLKSSDRIFM
mgnify:CR=1 FL=1